MSTTVINFEDPTILDNNNLNCGRGYLVYTPAINPAIVDLTDYNLHVVFHYTNSGQNIRLGTLNVDAQDIASVSGLTIAPRSYESGNQLITATHTLDFKFTDGVCNVYYDGTSTGVSKDFNGTTKMICLAGYNTRASGSTQGLHIEEISVGDVPTPTPVATSLSVTTLASTTGSASIKATLTANGSGVSGATIECSNGTTLITSNTTDNNGECTLDLSTLQAGSYTLTIEYDGDTTYQGSSITHSIIITSPQEWTIADISTSSTEWTVTPQQDGVHATGSYQAWKTQIPPNTTLRITANITDGVDFNLKDTIINNKSGLSFKSNGIPRWGQVGSGTLSTDRIPIGNGVIVELTNNGNGEFLYNYSDGTSGTIQLNSNKLDYYYFTFKNDGSGEVVITDLRYHPNS
jgi:hypothetical protein